MAVKTISAQVVHEMLEQGAVLVDIRSAGEYAQAHIEGARNIAPKQVTPELLGTGMGSADEAGQQAVIFHCLSGMRTQLHAKALEHSIGGDIYLMAGGLNAWKKAGLPVVKGGREPMSIFRQVQIIAGLLVVLGVVLGAWVSPWGYALSLFVGAGLVFAGVSGFCGMAALLMKMPWNRTHTPE